MKFMILAVLIALPSGIAAGQAEPSQSNESQILLADNHGFGFGLNGGGNKTAGLNVHYDFNLAQVPYGFSQIHSMLSFGTRSETNLDESVKAELDDTRLAVAYRFVFRGGFYLGGGLGYSQGKISYTVKDSWLTTGVLSDEDNVVFEEKFNLSLIHAAADIGWQGDDGYYFTVGYQPGATIYSSSDVDLARIPDVSNHRSKIREFEDDFDNSSLFYISFGWYLL